MNSRFLDDLVAAKTLTDGRSSQFCRDFRNLPGPKKLVFGRNKFATSIAALYEVDGFIDEYTDESTYLGKPIVRLGDIDSNCMVISTVIGRLLTVERKLAPLGCRHIDYFAFRKHADPKPLPARFEDHFLDELIANAGKYEEVFHLLHDETSKNLFRKIVNFRVSSDIAHLAGFTERQDEQYFEDFLNLSSDGETFADVGSYDGYTSEQFMLRYPGYARTLVFEPIEKNMSAVKQRLATFPRVEFLPIGLSSRRETRRFTDDGSASRLDEGGEILVQVDRLDDVLHGPVTFVKMDIEGGEPEAIEGARETIRKNHPAMAISVYHQIDDIWRIPELVLSCRRDYTIHLRHYTEGVDETVMFFVPNQ